VSTGDDRADARRVGLAAVVWLATCGGAVCLALTGALSIGNHPSPLEIGNAFIVLVVVVHFARAKNKAGSPATGPSAG